MHQDTLKGCLWMALAVVIWASWLVLTSSGRTTDLSILDLAGLRALIPTILLAPYLWSRRGEIARIRTIRCLLLSAYGAPFTLSVGYGLSFAPVAHAGALVPGMMPLLAAAIGFMFLGQRLQRRQAIGYLLILIATFTLVFRSNGGFSPEDFRAGQALFLVGACCWACFAVTSKTSDISPYLATAIVGAVSSAGVVPFWIFSGYSNLGVASLPDILFQAFFQGVASGLASLFAFTRALGLIRSRASMLAALTPGTATLLAVPVLGQVPDGAEMFALSVVVVGLFLSAAGSPPVPRPSVDCGRPTVGTPRKTR